MAGIDRDTGQGQPIDLAFLAGQTFGDAGLEVEVLRLFVAQSQACLDRLSVAADAATAHLIVGSARGIGAGEVAAAAAALEAALTDGRAGTGELDRLRAAIDVAATFIGERVSGR
jgi:hypothetical protein